MSKVILDDELRAKFHPGRTMTEVCDAEGTTVGYFVTPEQFEKMMYAWAKTLFTDEEAEQAWESYLRNGGVSTREALERAKAKADARESAA